MGLGSWICSIITSSAKVFVVTLLAACAIQFLPKCTFTGFNITQPQPMTGKLALNNLLNNAERLFEHEIKGPEGLAVLDGELYTSLHGGYVIKISNGEIVPIIRFGQPCEHWWEEDICGRPLGLATTEDGHLIVADAYYGIWKLNPKTGVFNNLVDKDTEIKGKVPKFFNDVTVAKDGTIYWTHSSSDFHLYDGIYAMLADPSGRLLKYDPVKKKSEVLLDGLHLANGVALSQDEDFVLVCETGMGRITRFYLKGDKRWESDIFIDGLPGLPDGLRPNGKGGFFVSLNVPRDENNPVLSDILAPLPLLRRILANYLAFSDWFVRAIHRIYPNQFTRRVGYIIGHFEMITPFLPDRTTIIELQGNGEVSESFHGLDGSVKGISDVIVHKGYLYLGSPYNDYLGRISLSKLKNKVVDTGKRLK